MICGWSRCCCRAWGMCYSCNICDIFSLISNSELSVLFISGFRVWRLLWWRDVRRPQIDLKFGVVFFSSTVLSLWGRPRDQRTGRDSADWRQSWRWGRVVDRVSSVSVLEWIWLKHSVTCCCYTTYSRLQSVCPLVHTSVHTSVQPGTLCTLPWLRHPVVVLRSRYCCPHSSIIHLWLHTATPHLWHLVADCSRV